MKRICSVVLCLVLMGGMFDCNRNSQKNWTIGEMSTYVISDVIDMVLVKDYVSNTGATFTIENSIPITYTYGYDYVLEVLRDVAWYTVNGGATDAPAGEYNLFPGDSRDHMYGCDYGKLDPGTYRVVIEVFPKDAELDSAFIAGEFVVR